MVGPPDGMVVEGALRSAREHDVPHALLAAAEIRRRFPFTPPDGTAGLLEARAGVLDPEACITACLEGAREAGADLRFDEAVESWTADGSGVSVRTAGSRFRAERLVLATGPWLASLLRDLALPLAVERQLMHWFEPRG
jgi:sarcosine oxidase